MTQPEYVPLQPADKVRPTETLPPARSWRPERPGDLAGPDRPSGGLFGTPGPDSGYGLKLASDVAASLALSAGEHRSDVEAALFAVGSKRAALFGRAPVRADFATAATILGFWVGAPADLVAWRRVLVAGAGHSYADARMVAAAVPESTLRLRPESLPERLAADWRALVAAEPVS